MTYAIGDGIGGIGVIILVAHYVVKAQKRKQFFSYFLHKLFQVVPQQDPGHVRPMEVDHPA